MKESGGRARSPSWLGGKAGRRSILGGFGAAALTSATAVFGRQEAQAAAGDACCSLVYPPGNYGACMDGRHYAWTCKVSSTKQCVCCERLRTDGDIYASAFRCS